MSTTDDRNEDGILWSSVYDASHCMTLQGCGIGVVVSHLKETPTPGPIRPIWTLYNLVAVCLTFVQFILQLKLCLHQ